jgi:hypothetical protein
MHTDGVITRRAGLPVLRPSGVVTPCWKCPKLQDSDVKDRHHAQEPTPRTRRALQHYLECRAVGVWPTDPIVRRNARLIRDIEDVVARRPLEVLSARISEVITLLVTRAAGG